MAVSVGARVGASVPVAVPVGTVVEVATRGDGRITCATGCAPAIKLQESVARNKIKPARVKAHGFGRSALVDLEIEKGSIMPL